MKTIEIIGYNRANLGKKPSKDLRTDSNVPCVLYGGEKEVHFYSPMILFKDLLYTPEAKFVELNIEGEKFKCIMQEVQFHPVNEMILHVDFLQIEDNKEIKMDIPLAFVGSAEGVLKGGKMIVKLKRLMLKGLPADMPEKVEVDITNLDLGKSIKVRDLTTKNYKILSNLNNPIVGVEIPRSLKSDAPVGAK